MKIFLFLVFIFVTTLDAKPEYIVSESLVIETAAKILKTEKKYLKIDTIENPKDKGKTLIVQNHMECGVGTCRQLVFVQVKKNKNFKYVGDIQGQIISFDFNELKSNIQKANNNEFAKPNILTKNAFDKDQVEHIVWSFNEKEMIYEAK